MFSGADIKALCIVDIQEYFCSSSKRTQVGRDGENLL